MTFSITTHNIMTLSITTHNIMTFTITTLSIMTFNITLKHDTQHTYIATFSITLNKTRHSPYRHKA